MLNEEIVAGARSEMSGVPVVLASSELSTFQGKSLGHSQYLTCIPSQKRLYRRERLVERMIRLAY